MIGKLKKNSRTKVKNRVVRGGVGSEKVS